MIATNNAQTNNARKPFVSCFRVVKGFENRKNYKVEPLPKEYHAIFQEKV